MIKSFPTFKQLYAKDCGPATLKIISKYYKKDISIEYLRELCETSRVGTNLESLSKASEKIGFKALPVKLSPKDLESAPLPCILHWKENHFVVLYKIKNSKDYYISDPEKGLFKYNKEQFCKNWIPNFSEKNNKGVVLLLENVFNFTEVKTDSKKNNPVFFFLSYLKTHRALFFQLILGLLFSGIIELSIPFLNQSIIDVGIKNQDLNFINITLFSFLFLIIGKFSIEILRDWILIHIGYRIKINLISDFLIKLTQLPISFFDSKITGDILQRIQDNNKIRVFFTKSMLNLIFSVFSILILSPVLFLYGRNIFFYFFIGTIIHFGWYLLFLKKRRNIESNILNKLSEDNEKVIELVNGMQDIKINNATRREIFSWEKIQANLYKLDSESLKLDQYQSTGASFINEIKNIFLVIISAKLVINGDITLGMLLSIMYIIGQLNLPFKLLSDFIIELQDAKIAFKRLEDIVHQKKDILQNTNHNFNDDIINIEVKNLNFKYPGSDNFTLKNISFKIEKNKTTAIVGKSGSGKTTLMKLLLNFYEPTSGHIKINNKINLENISENDWWKQIGVVLQEGNIFNDTIKHNITLTDSIDDELLNKSIRIANINNLIDKLPYGIDTKIGNIGLNLSGGERQRILIARAIYKNPKILFFDEATASLDTENELAITNNLNEFLKSKSSLIIAHRLSTVKNADEIIVLDNGNIVEQGNHLTLINKKGAYYNLIKNQLELI